MKSTINQLGFLLIPTLYLARSIDWSTVPAALKKKGQRVLPLADKSFQTALNKHIKIAPGTDAAVYPHADNADEFAVPVELGQSAIEAIRSATINTAELFGVKDRGRIIAGLLADLIAVKGDPLQDITLLQKVKFVMKEGQVYKLISAGKVQEQFKQG